MSDDFQALATVGSCWRDPEYPLRQQALLNAAPEFCLSKPSFELAMDWIFAHWTIPSLRGAQRRGNPGKNDELRNAIQILAGTTPAMIAQGFLQGSLLGIPQYLKLPRQQTTFAHLLYQSFQEQAPELAALFTLDDGKDLTLFYDKLKKADLVIAYGQDETMATLKSHLDPNATFIAHGHAESAAIIFKEAANIDSLKKLAYDMLSYDQRGCLSPRVTFIEQGGELSPAECAQQFAEIILPHFAEQFPRGGLFEGEAAEILHQRTVYAFRGKIYTGQDWTVCYDENLTWPKEALPRFMPFKPFEHINNLVSLLHSLISIGYAGPSERIMPLKNITSRFCVLEEMQKQCLIF